MDPDLKALIQVLIEGQIRTDKSVADLTALVASHVELSDARAARLDEAHIRTEQAIAGYVAAADARMVRIEANLDGLIRAITREHSNGKRHQ